MRAKRKLGQGTRVSVVALTALFFLPNSSQAGDVFKGQELYNLHCAGCHGTNGEGEMPGMPNFTRAEKLIKTDNQLADVVRAGSGVMPSFNGRLAEDEIFDIVSYIRTFL